MALTHRELCQIAYKFLKRNGFKVCFHDRFIAVMVLSRQLTGCRYRNHRRRLTVANLQLAVKGELQSSHSQGFLLSELATASFVLWR